MMGPDDIADKDEDQLWGLLAAFPARSMQDICRQVRTETYNRHKAERMLHLDAACLERIAERLGEKHPGRDFSDVEETVEALREVEPGRVETWARTEADAEYGDGPSGRECPFQRTNGMHNACRSCPLGGRLADVVRKWHTGEGGLGAPDDDERPSRGRSRQTDHAEEWETYKP